MTQVKSPTAAPARAEADDAPTPRGPRLRDAALVVLMLVPALAAVWAVPWFVTQDGLAHLYNAEILVDSLRGGPTFGEFYEVRWEPLPNWGGHLTLMALLAAFEPRAADRMMTSITLLGVALAATWLRGQVGGRPTFASRAFAVLTAMSFSWLMGFASFQLGACLFAVTLGVWWPARDDLGPGRMAAIAGLLVVGYFCHLVSLGLTVLALGLLALTAPAAGPDRPLKPRLARLAACLVPVFVLLGVYLRLSRQGGAMTPRFAKAEEYFSVAGWMGRLGWVDPISFAIKTMLPFTERLANPFVVFSPMVWLVAAGGMLLLGAFVGPREEGTAPRERRAWLALAALLILAGVFGPDSMGEGHGDYLPQRVALLGLVAAGPAIGSPWRTRAGRMGAAAMGVALALQLVSVWDYALYAQQTAGPVAESAAKIGRGVRAATLLGDLRTRFRITPVMHASCWPGVAGANVVWDNYETRYYYFPVQFRPGRTGPDSKALEDIALLGPGGRAEGVRKWERELEDHHDAIDVLVIWRGDEPLDAVARRWFGLAAEDGDVRVYRPRGPR